MPPITLPPAVQPHENFLQRLGDWLDGIFGESHDLYNKLTLEEKAAAVWGTGVIACINHHIDDTPDDVKKLISVAFPHLDLENVHGFLDLLLSKVNNIQGEVPLTLEDAIADAQKYLKQYEDHNIWGVISGAAANILSTLISPETPIEKFINIAVTVYQTIVRPHVVATAATINTSSVDVTDPDMPMQVDAPSGDAAEVDPDMQISNEAKAELSAGQNEENHPQGGVDGSALPSGDDAADQPGKAADIPLKNGPKDYSQTPPAQSFDEANEANLDDPAE